MMRALLLLVAFFIVVNNVDAGRIQHVYPSRHENMAIFIKINNCDLVHGIEGMTNLFDADEFRSRISTQLIDRAREWLDPEKQPTFLKLSTQGTHLIEKCTAILRGQLPPHAEWADPFSGFNSAQNTRRSLLSMQLDPNSGLPHNDDVRIAVAEYALKTALTSFKMGVSISAFKTASATINSFNSNNEKRATQPNPTVLEMQDDEHAIVLAYNPRVETHGRRLQMVLVNGTHPQVVKIDGNPFNRNAVKNSNPDLEKVVVTGPAPTSTPWHLKMLSGGGAFTPPPSYAALPQGKIYIVDTSILPTHEEFLTADLMSTRASVYWNAYSGQQLGCNGHATVVGSLAAGRKCGVCTDCLIINLAALGCNGLGFFSDILTAMSKIEEHCTTNNYRGITINMSFGSYSSSVPLMNALTTAFNSLRAACDAVFVTSAGNSQADACGFIPAQMNAFDEGDLITVGAVNENFRFSRSFSNYGACVTILAPGEETYAGVSDSTTSYGFATGTSMSAPLVAGVVAKHQMTAPGNWASASSVMAKGAVVKSDGQSFRNFLTRINALLYGTLVKIHVGQTGLINAIEDVPTATPNRLLHYAPSTVMNYTVYAQRPQDNSDFSDFDYIAPPPDPAYKTSAATPPAVFSRHSALFTVALVSLLLLSSL